MKYYKVTTTTNKPINEKVELVKAEKVDEKTTKEVYRMGNSFFAIKVTNMSNHK